MAKVSKQSATRMNEYPVAVEHSGETDEYTVNFVSITETHDLAPMLKVLPGGLCRCPHWGYMVKGTMTVTYPDRTETIEAGDAFYLPPGHTPAANAGAEFVLFSPSDELAATDAAIKAGMQAAQQA